MGFRLAKTFNLQFLYNVAKYEYFESDESDMIDHTMEGQGIGVSFGILHLFKKEKAIQVMLSFRQVPMTGKDTLGEEVSSNLIQTVFSVSFVFASFHKVFTEAKIFKGLI